MNKLRVIQLSHPDQHWLSDADSSKICLGLKEQLPSAIGSRPVLSHQQTWCSAITVMAVILRCTNVLGQL